MDNRLRTKWYLSAYYNEDYTHQDVFGLLATENEVREYIADMVKKFLLKKGTGYGTVKPEQVKKPGPNTLQSFYACGVSGREKYNISAFTCDVIRSRIM